jgi:cytidine deaminase
VKSHRRRAFEGGAEGAPLSSRRSDASERGNEESPPRGVPGRAQRHLYDEARTLAQRAYAPYSGFRVGAVVVGPSGRSFHGVNVENAAYPAGLCAERAALAAMVAGGERQALLVAVAAADGGDCLPCGLCLQALAEFGDPVIVAAFEGDVRVRPLSTLLTVPFPAPAAQPEPAP